MEDLFGNEIKPIKIYNRDSAGRFSDEKTAKYEHALRMLANTNRCILLLNPE